MSHQSAGTPRSLNVWLSDLSRVCETIFFLAEFASIGIIIIILFLSSRVFFIIVNERASGKAPRLYYCFIFFGVFVPQGGGVVVCIRERARREERERLDRGIKLALSGLSPWFASVGEDICSRRSCFSLRLLSAVCCWLLSLSSTKYPIC